MTTDTDLRARLRDLADDAPHPGLSGDDLWTAGVRRQRLRRAATVAGAAVVVAVVVGLTSVLRLPGQPLPAEGPAELGIPRVVVPPDPWSAVTATPGPLAAVSIAMRYERDGLTGTRSALQLFGVSAVDGVARFLDLPGVRDNVDPMEVALAPDGSRVAAVRSRGGDVLGWDVLDTTTGELTRLREPGEPALSDSWGYEIGFTSDGRYLRTTLSLTGSEESHDDSFVAWDVTTGERFVAEGPGHYWLPGPANGPGGVLWTRGRDLHAFDPATGDRSELSLPHQLVDAFYSPGGETLAYVGHDGEKPSSRAPWRLHVRTPDGQTRQLDVGIAPAQVLGWRDDTHVVVGISGPRGARVVDVVTGEWERLPLSQDGDALMTPRYATDLLALPIADPVEQPEVGDPRPWMHAEVQWIAGGMLLGGVLQVWYVWRRRRGRA